MPDIASTDVTYTLRNAAYTHGPQGYRRVFDIAFGNSALTYPTGGIPLDVTKLGCINNLLTVSLDDEGFNGASSTPNTIWEWDSVNNKLRAVNESTLVGAAVAPQLLRAEVVGY